MEKLFEFLFKYRPIVFERGDMVFSMSLGVAAAILAGFGLVTVFLYARVRGKSTPVDRLFLSLIRVAVVAVLLFVLARPVLVVSTSVPQKNFLGIVVDDSRSMRINDGSDSNRGDLVRAAFGTDSDLYRSLSERFLLRFFRFSGETRRVGDVGALDFDGTTTRIGGALNRARQELSGVPVAGLILVTDGADNSSEDLSDALVPLEAANLPVFTVGVGVEEFDRDIALQRVETPRTVLKGAALVVDLTITQRGFRGRTVELVVEDSDRIISRQEVELPDDGDAARVRVHLTADETGPRFFRFRVPTLDGELVTQNNEQEALVIVEDRREKILYFEGEPRFEVAFMRRAVADDPNLRLVVLQRTAEDKYLRLDVEGEDELAAGFPRTREELFSYRGLILGSVEASFFTHDQLRMIAEFVSQRGGGLLFLGGRRAFAEGGYAGTPLEDVMPVVLESPSQSGTTPLSLDVRLTPAGMTHAVTQLGTSEDNSAEVWEGLPNVTSVNPITRVKPGAVVLASAATGGGENQVVLAHQRYGRGKVIAFTVQDSWLWQMHADVPLEDMSHETLWRQMLRWLVSYVPDRVSVSTARDRSAPGDVIEVSAEVEDESYLGVNNTHVVAEVLGPTGGLVEFPLEWAVERDGLYRGNIPASAGGLYEIRVNAFADGELAGSDTTYVEVSDLDTEYHDAEMKSGALRRIADETGGLFYTMDDLGTLAEDIAFSESGATVVEERELWNMPILFFSIILLTGVEWGYRRAKGLS